VKLEVSPKQLETLFDGPVAVCIATENMYRTPLAKEEYNAVRNSVGKRREEFAAGRAAAREAMKALGGPVAPIPVGPDRSPIWPIGYTGSITHCSKFCGAVAAMKRDILSVGFDAEVITDLSPDILGGVCGSFEKSMFPDAIPGRGLSWSQIAFSAKEAFYKCYYPLAQRVLDFRDVSLRFYPGSTAGVGGFAVVTPDGERDFVKGFVGRWLHFDGVVFSGVICRD
jgi:4'-phosphopantetheinyl transferase EntD